MRLRSGGRLDAFVICGGYSGEPDYLQYVCWFDGREHRKEHLDLVGVPAARWIVNSCVAETTYEIQAAESLAERFAEADPDDDEWWRRVAVLESLAIQLCASQSDHLACREIVRLGDLCGDHPGLPRRLDE